MDKMRTKARVLLVLGIFSIFSAVVGTPLLAWTMLKGWYMYGVPVAVFTAHGFYGMPLYFSARYRARVDLACIEAMSRMKSATVAELAEATGLTERAARARAQKCVKRGYLTVSESDGVTTLKYVGED